MARGTRRPMKGALPSLSRLESGCGRLVISCQLHIRQCPSGMQGNSRGFGVWNQKHGDMKPNLGHNREVICLNWLISDIMVPSSAL